MLIERDSSLIENTDSDLLVIGDLGIVRPEYDIRSKHTSEKMNNFYYSAPEQINSEPEKASYKFDSWAAGVFLFEMTQGFHPFLGKDIFETR